MNKRGSHSLTLVAPDMIACSNVEAEIRFCCAVPLRFPDEKPGWRGHALWMGLLAVGVFLVYGNSLLDGFAMDAALLLLKTPAIREASAANVHTIITNDYWYPIMTGLLNRPLTILSFPFNYAILGNGTNPMGCHAVNIALHAVYVWLVYGLRSVLLGACEDCAQRGAFLAVHPIGTETVANVAGRAELLATMFLLAVLLLFLRGTSMRGWRVALCAAGVFAGLLAKESGAVVLGLMLAWNVAYGFR